MPVRINERGLFERIDYHPHGGQVPLHSAFANHRFVTASCGRRFGKSQVGGHKLTTTSLIAQAEKARLEPKGKRHEYWIVGPEYSDAEKEFRVVYNDLLKLGADFDHPGTYYSEGGGDMDISLFGGRFLVHAKSAKYPATLVGEALKGVIMAEAAKIKPNVWVQYIRPTLSDYAKEAPPSWALFTSTPEGKNWFYDLYMRGLSADPLDKEWFGLRRPSWANDILFPMGRTDPEILEMERDMTQEKFKQEIGADFTEFVGRVFKDFDVDTHVGTFNLDPRLPVYIAEDSGYTNPSVALFVQVDAFDNVTIIGEYYQRHRMPTEFGSDVLNDTWLGPMVRQARHMYPDPADPGTAAELARMWNVQVMPDTGGLVQDRIDLIRRWLKVSIIEGDVFNDDPGKARLTSPKLMVDHRCVNVIREFQDYRYPENKREQDQSPSENPMKIDDHTPEALGRFFKGHFGKQALAAEATRVSKARLNSRNR